MSFNDNKYRIRFSTEKMRGQRRGYTRLEAIKELAEAHLGSSVTKKIDYHQRRMRPEHRKALFEVARLWRRLDEYEREVKERKAKSKPNFRPS